MWSKCSALMKRLFDTKDCISYIHDVTSLISPNDYRQYVESSFLNGRYVTGRNEQYVKQILRDGLKLSQVPKPCYYLCLLAVQQNGLALEYVPEDLQSYEICVTAARQNSNAFDHIKKVTAPIITTCVRFNPSLLSKITFTDTKVLWTTSGPEQKLLFDAYAIVISALIDDFSSLRYINYIPEGLFLQIRYLKSYDAKIVWSHQQCRTYLDAEAEGPVTGTREKFIW